MKLAELLNKRVVIISGKGGVGKTTLAVTLGLLAAGLKKKTLLVEMNSTERIAPLFGLKEIGYNEIPLAPFLTGINLNPHDAFEEYVLMQIRFKKIFDTFINNKFVTYFLNAVPGLNDLLMIGKIYELEREVKGRFRKQKLYDLLIVDAPATGHGVSAFEVPSIVSRAVHVGPLRHRSDKILNLLHDTEKTVFSVVTLAEEMPVIEANELIPMVKDRLKFALGPLFLNNLHSSALTESDYKKINSVMPEDKNELFPYFGYAKLDYERSELNKTYADQFIEQNREEKVLFLPNLPGGISKARDLEPLVDELMSNLET